jgi:hypothetical protein
VLAVLTYNSGFGTGMAESTVFISLSSSVEKSVQAVALSGLFQSVNVGAIVGLATSSAVLQLTLRNQLQTKLDGYDKKEKVSQNSVRSLCPRTNGPFRSSIRQSLIYLT